MTNNAGQSTAGVTHGPEDRVLLYDFSQTAPPLSRPLVRQANFNSHARNFFHFVNRPAIFPSTFRGQIDPSPPLSVINPRIPSRFQCSPNRRPNTAPDSLFFPSMFVLHGLQRVASVTKGQNLTIVVRGKGVCEYCLSSNNLVAAADRAGLNNLTVVDTNTRITYVWTRGTQILVKK